MTKFRRTAIAAAVVAAEAACLALAFNITVSIPAEAQFFDHRYPFLERRRRGGGFFSPYYEEEKPQDFSRAPNPAPRKPDAPPVSTRILVLGDSMADWLAYGLEDALSESPEIGILRKHRTFSGLIRYENKPDAPEWSQVAREIIAAEKPHAIIMMIGVQDRQGIREKQPAKDQKPQPGAQQKPDAKPDQSAQQQAQDDEQPNIIAPEQSRPRVAGLHEYKSEKWEELYNKKIEDTIAALKTGNVPVLWVGLPSIRGAKSTADALYLNEFYRARAENAGILYVDLWDGFVDEQGRFSTRGPDFEGQMRQLRAGDGVHFTRFGARKLAHYAERELRRVMSAIPVALTTPSPDQVQPQATPSAAAPARPAAPAQRPLAGPVFLLTANTEESDELLGGGPTRQPAIDPVATSVLVKGAAIASAAGRADDYSWPPRVPNIRFNEPLPPSGPPVMMVRPSQPRGPQTAQAAVPGQPGLPGQPRVAGQPVLQGQIAPYQGGPRGGWRAPPPAYYGPPRGFFGLFR